jgi:hypothetical protein
MSTSAPNQTKWGALERQTTAAAYRKEIKEQVALTAQYADRLKALEEQLISVLAVKQSAPELTPIVSTSGKDGEATAFAIASDWHAEERVRADSVNQLNEFSLAIAEKRIERFFQRIVRLTEIERNGTKIENLVLGLLGDLMTGYIHEELQESNGLSPVQAIVWLRDRILSGLEYLRKNGGFKRIVIVCAYGNHGRTTKKPRHATGAANSYEWLLYQVLAKDAEMAGMTDIEWNIASSYHTYLSVYGRNIRLHHGDSLRYEGGIGGLTIPVEKAIASWNKARVADLDIFGHWHTQQQNPKWVSNGSLIGFNAFSISIKAPFEPPQQTYFLFDSKRGRTATSPIFVE